ncbi:unnamed protein product [Mytilus edulis]|uniref:Uncharacterized protein n=1 Tax=Mytilus edulis TaxID=6550 RepID=A0A8S3UPX8_MYTED|nr:unnamed protein product [Mytilus edulis]
MAAFMQVPVPPHRKERHFRLKDDLSLNLSNEELRERYRFGREGINFISNLVSDDITRKTKRNHALTVPQMVMVTLRFLATGSFLQVVGDTIGKRIEYKSNYCTEPTPDTICNVEAGEMAVVMTGVMYPDVIESVNCACPNNDYNLQLKRAYYVSTFEITHEFVCSMRTCNMNTSNRRVCKKIKKDETTEYRCTCPEEYECRMEPSARKGYCERRVEM